MSKYSLIRASLQMNFCLVTLTLAARQSGLTTWSGFMFGCLSAKVGNLPLQIGLPSQKNINTSCLNYWK